ncbi:MAG: type II toxin-antitoxin system RelE/ParE family toxin [Lachnospiraceae bacterium]|nr:type II toxin-antitoxin system RelE/ParE family toxin [Lachnospiraceae bacterium]
MKKFTVVIANEAAADLQGIYDYIAYELLSPENADSQLTRLEKAIEESASFPEKYRRYETEPWRSRNLRYFPVDNFCVFYIPDAIKKTVTIIRVIYGGRDINKELNREYEQ